MTGTTTTKPDHMERTAAEPRDESLHAVILKKVDQINDQVRLFRLEIPTENSPPVRFQPGQWVDLFVPGIPDAGGFTITSTPAEALPSSSNDEGKNQTKPGHIELAVQKSPDNPAAAWLWQPIPSIVGTGLTLRIGGSFVWPPPPSSSPLPSPSADEKDVKGRKVDLLHGLTRLVFVAGGLGINPLISMLSTLAAAAAAAADDDDDYSPQSPSSPPPFEVRFLYSLRDDEIITTTTNTSDEKNDDDDYTTEKSSSRKKRRDASRILFLDRLVSIFASGRVKGRLQLFLTPPPQPPSSTTRPSGNGSDAERTTTPAEEEEGVIHIIPHPHPHPHPEAEEQEVVKQETEVPFLRRRLTLRDVDDAIGGAQNRGSAAVYVCGVPTMTDDLVARLVAKEEEEDLGEGEGEGKGGLGMEPCRVLCEKWW
ncbi:NADH-cytochrome b-5 reductase [Xylariomycetidae sp. FL2044]|nr:NADH-cytochrome b-5 reductase [Xylariomycetidae sp. FL2044]